MMDAGIPDKGDTPASGEPLSGAIKAHMLRIRVYAMVALCAINLLVVAWAFVILQQSRHEVEQRVEGVTQSMALALDQTITDAVHRIDLTLLSVIDELERQLGAGTPLRQDALNALLEKKRGRVSIVQGLRVSNDEGMVIGGVDIGTKFSVSDRDYFASHRSNKDNNLIVSKPVMGKFAGTWLIIFSRRYNHPSGAFAGVVIAAVPVSHFSQLLSTLAFGNRSSAILRDADTGLIARHPAVHGSAGEIGDKGYSKEIGELLKSGVATATYHTPRAADGIERTNSFRRLAIAPFTVIIGLASEDYLAEWRNETRKVAALLVLFAIVTSASAWFIARLLIRHAQDGFSLRQVNRRLRSTLEILNERDEALVATQEIGKLGVYALNIPSGIWTSSAELRNIFGIGPEFFQTAEGWLDLVHPDDREMMTAYFHEHVVAAKNNFDKDYRIVRPLDGETRWVHGFGKLELDSFGTPVRMTGAIQDITERRHVLEELDRIAHYDPLTGIPNRRLLSDRMSQAVARARRSKNLLAVCYLDLDGFKPINDQHGHAAGDQLLIAVSRHLQEVLRADDTVARLGGDEFVLLFNELANDDECLHVLQRVLAAVATPVSIGATSVTVSASIGVTIFPRDDADPDTLLRHADQAMYHAKDHGKNRFCFHVHTPVG